MGYSKTDEELSVSANEFMWNTESESDAHQFVRPVILEMLKQAGAKRVLDIGSGNGALTASIAEGGYEIVGLEYSESGVEIGRQFYPSIPFERYDVAEELPEKYRNAFDAVVSVEVIEHLFQPRRLFDNARLALKPGGYLIVTTPFHGYWKNLALAVTNKFDDHWHPLRDFGHIKFFSKATLERLFRESGYELERFSAVGRIPALARSMVVMGRCAGASPEQANN